MDFCNDLDALRVVFISLMHMGFFFFLQAFAFLFYCQIRSGQSHFAAIQGLIFVDVLLI